MLKWIYLFLFDYLIGMASVQIRFKEVFLSSLTDYSKMRKLTLVFLLCTCGNSIVFGQEQVDNPSSADTLYFRLSEANNLLVKTVLNGGDTLTLMLHTAANAVTLTEVATKRIRSIQWDAVDSTESWGGQQEARRSSYNTLEIGVFKWDSVAIWENTHSGPGTDGKFGLNLFDDKILEIDFEQGLLLVHDQLPTKAQQFSRLPLTGEAGLYFLPAMVKIENQTYVHTFLIHTGYGGTLLLDDLFVEETKLGEQLEILEEQELKDAYGNIVINQKALLPIFEIGQSRLKELPIGFFKGSIGRQKMSVIGGDLIKRFNWLLDVKEGYVYLEANEWAMHSFGQG